METIILTFDKPTKIKGNIFASIINLEAENNLLIEKTNLINKATHKKHSEILRELISDLNRKLKVIDFEFNLYKGDYTLTFENQFIKLPFSIRINAISDKGYKFVTYTGGYNIQISYHKLSDTIQNWTNCNDINKLEAFILNRIKQNKGLI